MRARNLALTMLIGLFGTDVPTNAQNCSLEAVVFFANGMDNDRSEARANLALLQEELEKRLMSTPISTTCVTYQLAYNQNETLLVELAQAAQQIFLANMSAFWRIWGGLDPAPDWFQAFVENQMKSVDSATYVTVADLQGHVSAYRTEILAGKKVVAVAHSQGNFYVNEAHGLISADPAVGPLDRFRIVAVATPAYFVGGGGPHTTLLEDFIWQLPLVPLPLRANTSNGPCGFPWDCHKFAGSYIQGSVSGLIILDDIVAAIISGTPGGFTQLSFSQSDYGVGSGPLALAVADFNGDGALDIASVDQLSASVSVLLNNGDGNFGSVMTYSTGPDPSAILAGDFNNDGRQDLATLSFGANTLSVFLGNGDGTFQPRVEFPTGVSPFSFRATTGDFNEDGNLDVAVTSVGLLATSVAILIGQGDGSFALGTPLVVGSQQSSVVTDDLNQDGHLDLAVSVAGVVIAALGTGNGAFGPFQPVSAGLCGVTTLIATDLNQDTVLDLVGGEGICGTAVIMIGAGGGLFNKATILDTSGGALLAIVPGDFDLDGKNDLAMAFQGPGQFIIFRGKGDGTFHPGLAFPVGGNLSSLQSIWAADFNRDGKLDVVVADHFTSTLSLFLNTSQ